MLDTTQKIHPVFIFACFLCALPVILTTYPPMVDLPQHAAQISLLKNMLSGDFQFSSLFELNLLTPYWIGYGLALSTSYFLDTLTAVKLVIACALILFPYSCALLRRELHAPSVLDWLFLPVAFGFAYQWGLMNFLVSAPVCILFLRDAYRYSEGVVSPWRMAIWVNVLFFAHIISMVFFTALAILLLLKPNLRFTALTKASLPFFASLPLIVIWFMRLMQHTQASSGGIQWDIGVQRLMNMLPNLLSLPYSLEYITLGLLAAAIPFLIGGRISKHIGRWLPFIFYTFWMLFAPKAFGGTFFIYDRFEMFGFPLYILMFDFSSKNSISGKNVRDGISAIVSISIGIFLLADITIKNYKYEQESAEFSELLEQMEPGKRALGLIFNNQSAILNRSVYLHFHAWYQAIHNGIVDFSFATFSPQVVHYKEEMRPTANDALAWMPWTFKWRYHNGAVYDYFIVRSETDVGTQLRSRNPNINLVVNRGFWWLYKQSGSQPETDN